MTRLFAPEPLTGLSHCDISYMSNYQDYNWQQPQQHYIPTSVSSSQYGDHQISVHDVDARVYRPGQTGYAPFPGSQHLLSPDTAYGEVNWNSDMEIGTPSTAHSGFSNNDMLDPFSPKMHNAQQSTSHKQGPLKAQQWAPAENKDQPPQNSHRAALARPQVQRAHTGPEARQRRVTVPNTRPDQSPNIKRSGSEESEDDYVPDGDTKNRGRKRQRIPHTAVERRYRENLNAHLDRLRQAVPALASRRLSGNTKATEVVNDQGVKPSKCEILSGAIDHIGNLAKENDALRSENQMLRNRMQELERWYTSGLHQTSYS